MVYSSQSIFKGSQGGNARLTGNVCRKDWQDQEVSDCCAKPEGKGLMPVPGVWGTAPLLRGRQG